MAADSASEAGQESGRGSITQSVVMPPLPVIKKLFRRQKEYGGRESVQALTANAMSRLIELAIGPSFDEEFYLQKYPDVRRAIADGKIASGIQHYLSSGFYEGRMPCDFQVDEEWYLATYPDVTNAIEGGKYESAKQHFKECGFIEGRAPNSDYLDQLRKWER
jgi:hypothetical protein